MDKLRYHAIRIMLYPFFHLWLKHLIQRNYRMRAISSICKAHNMPPCTPDGKFYYDEWYWADKLCAEYGYFVKSKPLRDEWFYRNIKPTTQHQK